MSAKFKMRSAGVGQLLRSPQMQAEMTRRAEVIKSVAESIAPVGGPADVHRGQYKSSFRVGSRQRGGARKNRATATVSNVAYYARWVEYGTDRVPAHHVLLRAARAGGR